MGGVAAFFLVGPSEAEILGRQAAWKAAVADNLLLALVLFCAAELLLVGLSLPVATGLSLLAGFLFGPWVGTLLVSFASTTGALLAMLAARYVLRGSLRRRIAARARWQLWLEALDRGFERDGWFYLLLIRMTPVLPFFAVNLLMGLTRVRPWTYWWTSQLGMLPTSFVVVSAGAGAGEIASFRELASLSKLWPLAFLVVIPIVVRLAAGPYLRRTAPSETGG